MNFMEATKASNGTTEAIIRLASDVRWDQLSQDVKTASVRHCLDTFGAIIAGASGDLTRRVEIFMSGGPYVAPGFSRTFAPLDTAYIAGVAGHGLELDDGYRGGQVHPGVAVLPAIIAASQLRDVSGQRFLESFVVGYETVIAIARACHPALRHQGFHPTGVAGPLGAAVAVAKLLGLSPEETRNAFGIAASAASGLFAFINGGADVKRLHAGHAAREGLAAALFAQNGVGGPPDVLESRDGFIQAFVSGKTLKEGIVVPPAAEFGLPDCYIKPYPCCRHLQPAVQALIELLRQHDLSEHDVERIDVETYSIAAAHADTGWGDFASAQLSFPYIMSVGLRERDVNLSHFSDSERSHPKHETVRRKLHIVGTPEMDALYPKHRPARVSIETSKGQFSLFLEEAPGSREFPLSEADLVAKFRSLTESSLGSDKTRRIVEQLLDLKSVPNISKLIADMKPIEPGSGQRSSAGQGTEA